MAILIQNGEIVTSDSRQRADLYIENETITRIGAGLTAPPGADVVDASGKLVFPGFIDPHVHIYLPFMSTFAKDTHQTASIAALIGGTTTYIEMCCPSRMDDALEGYQLWKAKAEGNMSSSPFTSSSAVFSTSITLAWHSLLNSSSFISSARVIVSKRCTLSTATILPV